MRARRQVQRESSEIHKHVKWGKKVPSIYRKTTAGSERPEDTRNQQILSIFTLKISTDRGVKSHLTS